MATTRTVTLLFTSLVDSSGSTWSVDSEPAEDGSGARSAMLRRVIDSTGGTEVKHPGGGFMAMFVSPGGALACAVGMQHAVQAHNRVEVDSPLSLQVGVATAQAPEVDGDPFGEPALAVARLCELARPGQILATEAVADLVGPWATRWFGAVGMLRLSGASAPVNAVEVVWRVAGAAVADAQLRLPSEQPMGVNLPELAGQVDFAVLGSLMVSAPDGPRTVAGARRRALLIRLLMTDNRPVPVGRLVEDVWEGATSQGAPSTLRSHLSLLRKIVGPDRLRSQHGAVTLEVRSGELDAARFESECDEGRRALARGDPDAAEGFFQLALARWRGPALSDVEGMSWALPEISRLNEERLEALEGLLDAHLRLGESQRVVAEAEAAVGEYPLRERLWFLLMSALYRSGRQADALRAYQRLRTHLGEELGIEPSPVTRALENAILIQHPSLDWSSPRDAALLQRAEMLGSEPAAPVVASVGAIGRSGAAATLGDPGTYEGGSDLTWLSPSGAPTFVGRVAELAAAERARQRALQGKQALLLITGEPGIGKTRLAAQIATISADAGDLVLYGRWQEEALSAFQGFRQAFGAFVQHRAGTACLEEIGSLAGPLAQVVPEASDRVPSLVDLTPATAEAERFRSFEAVVAFARAATRNRPLLLVLEDIQWADSPSISLLEHVLRSAIAVPVLIIATCRDTEAGGTGWLSDGLVSLRREVDVERLDLGGLSSSMSLALLQAAVGPAVVVDNAFEGPLREYTGGNPFFLQEVAMDMVARGDSNELALSPISRLGLSISERLRDVVFWRLSRLSEQCKQMLSVASTMGLEFEAAVAGAAAGNDESMLLSLLDEARFAAVITEDPEHPDRYRFAHDLVRQALYGELGTSRRVRLHLRIAQVLEDRFGVDPSRAAEIGLHYRLGSPAGSSDRALFYLRLAGEAALRQIAYEAAVELFEQALAINAEYFVADLEGRCELLPPSGRCDGQVGAAARSRRALRGGVRPGP